MTDYAELRRLAEAANHSHHDIRDAFAFYSNGNPATIITLIDTLEAQQERIAELERALHGQAPADMWMKLYTEPPCLHDDVVLRQEDSHWVCSRCEECQGRIVANLTTSGALEPNHAPNA